MADFTVKTEDINELVPLGDKVLVAPIPKEKILKSGIIIPDTANQPAMLGHVLAAGPGITTETGHLLPMPVKRGQIVAFTRYAGTDVSAGGGSYLLMRQDDLIAILDPDRRMDDYFKDARIAVLEAAIGEAAMAVDYAAKAGAIPDAEKMAKWKALAAGEVSA